METCNYIILILAFIILLIFVTFGYMKFKEIIAEHNNTQKERYCHYCHYAYIHKSHEDYIYCPICGNRLRAIDDDPFKKVQNGIAFTVDFDTWLESQPEGAFVQGGGIDEENSRNNDKKE